MTECCMSPETTNVHHGWAARRRLLKSEIITLHLSYHHHLFAQSITVTMSNTVERLKRKAKFVDKFEQFTRNCFAVD